MSLKPGTGAGFNFPLFWVGVLVFSKRKSIHFGLQFNSTCAPPRRPAPSVLHSPLDLPGIRDSHSRQTPPRFPTKAIRSKDPQCTPALLSPRPGNTFLNSDGSSCFGQSAGLGSTDPLAGYFTQPGPNPSSRLLQRGAPPGICVPSKFPGDV